MSENCKYEVRKREERRMAPRFLVRITGETDGSVTKTKMEERKAEGGGFCNNGR